MTDPPSQSSSDRACLSSLPNELLYVYLPVPPPQRCAQLLLFHRIHVMENNTRLELQAWARTCRRMRNVATTVFRNEMLNLGYGEPCNIPRGVWLLDEADGDDFNEMKPSRTPPQIGDVDGPMTNEEGTGWEDEEQDVWAEPHVLFRHGCVVWHVRTRGRSRSGVGLQHHPTVQDPTPTLIQLSLDPRSGR
jgi:hypothetical protein